MSQAAIPFHFFRGGTSRAAFFKWSDLPHDQDTLSKVLIKIMGAGNPRNIDGLGGGNAVTTKVAMLNKSDKPGVDIDYYFAQVAVNEELVDYGPTCGNVLVSVGPAAIEMGLIPASGDITTVRICAVNTGAIIESVVQTPSGLVTYQGDMAIDGVPGTSAPVTLNFLDVVGTKCGAMLPTGNARDLIHGIEVTLMDVAMPMMIMRASDLGITGYETHSELDDNKPLFQKMEAMRIEAGNLMELGDVTKSVMPKIGLISKARGNGHFSARYFMPWNCHPTLAITGAQCLAACALQPRTISEGLVNNIATSPTSVVIEHPMGEMAIAIQYKKTENHFQFISAGVTRTARLIARGEAMIPSSIIDNN